MSTICVCQSNLIAEVWWHISLSAVMFRAAATSSVSLAYALTTRPSVNRRVKVYIILKLPTMLASRAGDRRYLPLIS